MPEMMRSVTLEEWWVLPLRGRHPPSMKYTKKWPKEAPEKKMDPMMGGTVGGFALVVEVK